MQEQTESKLKDIFRAVLHLDAGDDVTVVQSDTAAAWDSLAHTLLVAAVESEFSLEIDAADSLDLTSYRAVASYIESRGF